MKSLHKGAALRSALSKWFPRLDVYVLGWILTVGSLLITTGLWIAARFPRVASSDLWPWRAFSQLTSMVHYSHGDRHARRGPRQCSRASFRWSRSRCAHPRVLGPSAILLLIAHVVFLALAEFQNSGSLGNVFIPFWSQSTRSIDILAFYALLLLGGLAYDRRMRYERWLFVHRLTGLGFSRGCFARSHGTRNDCRLRAFEDVDSDSHAGRWS